MSLMRTMVRLRSRMTTGGPVSARRLCTAAIVVLGVSGFHAEVAAVGEQANPPVIVHEDGGAYRVEARFAVPQTASIVFTVLTDYERIAHFMPGVRRSTVQERAPGRAVVEQEVHARFMMFSRRIHLVLEVDEQPAAIRFRDRCAKSFSQYEGSWQIDAGEKGTTVVYRLNAKPSFDVPEFLLKRLLRRDALHMIERLKLEIAARARTP